MFFVSASTKACIAKPQAAWCAFLYPCLLYTSDAADEEAILPKGNSSLSYTGPKSMTWWCSFKDSIPQDALLRLYVHRDSRKIRVPFVFKNIEIPPMPKEEDGTSSPGVKER